MKNLILIILTGLLIYGCGEKTGEKTPETQKDRFSFDTTDIKTVPVENPNRTFYLRYKLEKGNTYNFRLTAISKDDQSITSKDTTLSQGMDQTIIYNIKFTPTEIDADSTIEMDAEVTSVKLDGKYGDEPLHYQSGTPVDSADIKKYAQYESMIQSPFNLRVSKTGELLDIFRTDKILDKLIDLGGFKDSIKSDEKATLKNDLTEGVLKPLLNQIFRKLPTGNMAKDSSWKVEQPPTQMMVFQAQNTSIFKVHDVKKFDDDLVAEVGAGLNTRITGKNKLSDRGVNYEFQKPVTSGGGKIYFNITKGLIQKAKLSTSVMLSFNLESRGQKGSKKETIANTNILEYIPE